MAEERSATLGGIRTRWIEAGSGDTLVAVHGIPTSADLFLPVLPHLRGWRVVAPDLLGQGGTEVPRRGRLDHAAQARHLDACLEALAPGEVRSCSTISAACSGSAGRRRTRGGCVRSRSSRRR